MNSIRPPACGHPGERCGRPLALLDATLTTSKPGLRAMCEMAVNAYHAGDLDHALALVSNFLLVATDTATHDSAQRPWVYAANSLLAEVHLARGRPQDRREATDLIERALHDLAVEAFSTTTTDALRLGLLSTLAMIQYLEGATNDFADTYQQIVALPSAEGACGCLRDIRIRMLHALGLLLAMRYEDAEQAFTSVARAFRLFTPFWALVADLGAVEALARRGDITDAVQRMRAIDEYITHFSDLRGAIIVWGHLFPQVIALAKQHHFRWPLSSQPRRYVTPVTSFVAQPPQIRAHAFGVLRVTYNEAPLAVERFGQASAALLYLLMNPDGADADQMLRHVWPERAFSSNRNYLQQQISTLGKLFGESAGNAGDGAIILSQHSMYQIPAALTWVDVRDHEAYYNAACAAASVGDLEAELRLLKAAIQIKRGNFLQGVENLWVEQQRSHFTTMQAWMLWRMAAVYLQLGEPREAIRALEDCMWEDETFTRAVADLMRLYDQYGMREKAIQTFEMYRERVKRLFHSKPSAEIMELRRRFDQQEDVVTAPFESAKIASLLRPAPSSITSAPLDHYDERLLRMPS